MVWQGRGRKGFIIKGQVICDQEVAKKANRLVSRKSEPKVTNLSKEWVSRGGFKLVGAIEHFKIELKNKICLMLSFNRGFTHVYFRGVQSRKRMLKISVGYEVKRTGGSLI